MSILCTNCVRIEPVLAAAHTKLMVLDDTPSRVASVDDALLQRHLLLVEIPVNAEDRGFCLREYELPECGLAVAPGAPEEPGILRWAFPP